MGLFINSLLTEDDTIPKEAFEDSADQDQNAQNMQSGFWSILSMFSILDQHNCFRVLQTKRRLFLVNEKAWLIYSIVKEVKRTKVHYFPKNKCCPKYLW